MNQSHKSDSAPSSLEPGTSSAESPGERVDTSKRRFTRAGLSGSVVMTLSSRPAMASFCSHSGTMSGNLSRPGGGATCRGNMPSFWRDAGEMGWGSCGLVPGKRNVITLDALGATTDYNFVTFGALNTALSNSEITSTEYDEYANWAGWSGSNPGASAVPNPMPAPTTLGQALGASGLMFTDANRTLMQTLWDGGQNPQDLLSHAIAGLLNICAFGSDSYGYTAAEFQAFINEFPGSSNDLNAALALLNGR